MKVVDGRWSPKGIILKIACSCNHIFEHPSWKRWATCSDCGEKGDLIEMKGEDEERVERALGPLMNGFF